MNTHAQKRNIPYIIHKGGTRREKHDNITIYLTTISTYDASSKCIRVQTLGVIYYPLGSAYGTEAKISLYTTFLVSFVQFPFPSSMRILSPFSEVTRDRAT